MKKPRNQNQQALWYLLTFEQVDMKFVILDSLFHKFNTRLSEVESEFGTLTNKERKLFTNRFGRKSSYLEYSLKDRQKALDVYDRL